MTTAVAFSRQNDAGSRASTTEKLGGDRGAGARENRGREGYGRRDLYDGGKWERNSKSQAFFFVTAYFQSKKRTQQRFLTSI